MFNSFLFKVSDAERKALKELIAKMCAYVDKDKTLR